jgi:hypothetical protein
MVGGEIGYSDNMTREDVRGGKELEAKPKCSDCSRRGPVIRLNGKQLCPVHFKIEFDKAKQ